MGGFNLLTWAGKKLKFDQKVEVRFLPICRKSGFPQTLAMPSPSLDRPLSEMVALTPCLSYDYIIYSHDKVP